MRNWVQGDTVALVISGCRTGNQAMLAFCDTVGNIFNEVQVVKICVNKIIDQTLFSKY
jgi:hypothetical protein